MGSVYAGLMADAGHAVHVVCRRGPHVEAIAARGLRVTGHSGDRTVAPASAVLDAADVALDRPADLVVVATKAYDVAVAARSCAHLVGPGTVVQTIQNGLGSPEVAAAELDPGRIAVGVVGGFGASLPEPGVAHHNGMEMVRFGPYDGLPAAQLEASRRSGARRASRSRSTPTWAGWSATRSNTSAGSAAPSRTPARRCCSTRSPGTAARSTPSTGRWPARAPGSAYRPRSTTPSPGPSGPARGPGCDRAPHPLLRPRRLQPRGDRARARHHDHHRERPGAARLHLRADERDPRALPPGDRRDRPRPGRPARPPLQRDAVAAGAGAVRAAVRLGRRRPGPGDAADHRRGVQRGRDPDGQAGHRPARDRLLRPVLARHDPGRGERHLRRRARGVRARRPRQLRAAGARPLPPRPRRRRRGARLAPPARPRVRPDRRPVRRQPRRLHRRAGPVLRRGRRPAAGLPGGAARQVPRARHAADPRRGPDRAVPHRRLVRPPARRRGPGHPHAVQDARGRPAARRRPHHGRDRGGRARARLPVLHHPRQRPAPGRGRAHRARRAHPRPARPACPRAGHAAAGRSAGPGPHDRDDRRRPRPRPAGRPGTGGLRRRRARGGRHRAVRRAGAAHEHRAAARHGRDVPDRAAADRDRGRDPPRRGDPRHGPGGGGSALDGGREPVQRRGEPSASTTGSAARPGRRRGWRAPTRSRGPRRRRRRGCRPGSRPCRGRASPSRTRPRRRSACPRYATGAPCPRRRSPGAGRGWRAGRTPPTAARRRDGWRSATSRSWGPDTRQRGVTIVSFPSGRTRTAARPGRRRAAPATRRRGRSRRTAHRRRRAGRRRPRAGCRRGRGAPSRSRRSPRRRRRSSSGRWERRRAGPGARRCRRCTRGRGGWSRPRRSTWTGTRRSRRPGRTCPGRPAGVARPRRPRASSSRSPARRRTAAHGDGEPARVVGGQPEGAGDRGHRDREAGVQVDRGEVVHAGPGQLQGVPDGGLGGRVGAQVGAVEHGLLGEVGVAVQEHPPLRVDPQVVSGADRGEDDRGALVDLVARDEEPRVRVGDHPVAVVGRDELVGRSDLRRGGVRVPGGDPGERREQLAHPVGVGVPAEAEPGAAGVLAQRVVGGGGEHPVRLGDRAAQLRAVPAVLQPAAGTARRRRRAPPAAGRRRRGGRPRAGSCPPGPAARPPRAPTSRTAAPPRRRSAPPRPRPGRRRCRRAPRRPPRHRARPVTARRSRARRSARRPPRPRRRRVSAGRGSSDQPRERGDALLAVARHLPGDLARAAQLGERADDLPDEERLQLLRARVPGVGGGVDARPGLQGQQRLQRHRQRRRRAGCGPRVVVGAAQLPGGLSGPGGGADGVAAARGQELALHRLRRHVLHTGQPHRAAPHPGRAERERGGHLVARGDAARGQHRPVPGDTDDLRGQHRCRDGAGVPTGLGALRDEHVDPGRELPFGVPAGPDQRGDDRPGVVRALHEVRRRGPERVRDERGPVGEHRVELGLGAAPAHPRRDRVAPGVDRQPRDAVAVEQVVDEGEVLGRELRTQRGDEVLPVGPGVGGLLRDEQVDPVGPPVELLLDPGQLRVELLGGVGDRGEHPEPPGTAHLGHHRGGPVEPDDRVLDAQQIGQRCPDHTGERITDGHRPEVGRWSQHRLAGSPPCPAVAPQRTSARPGRRPSRPRRRPRGLRRARLVRPVAGGGGPPVVDREGVAVPALADPGGAARGGGARPGPLRRRHRHRLAARGPGDLRRAVDGVRHERRRPAGRAAARRLPPGPGDRGRARRRRLSRARPRRPDDGASRHRARRAPGRDVGGAGRGPGRGGGAQPRRDHPRPPRRPRRRPGLRGSGRRHRPGRGTGAGSALAVGGGDLLRPGPPAVGGALRPALRRVLPDLLAAVGQQVDQREQVGQLLGAAAVGVPGAEDAVAVAQEHVDREAAAGGRPDIGAEGAVRRRVPGHGVPDPPPVRQRLVDRALGDDDEPGVELLQAREPGELRGEPGAPAALPVGAVVPHVAVDDQLRVAVEDLGEADGAVLATQDVVGHLDHRQPATGGGDGVELAGGGLLPDAQRVELALPGRGVDDGGQGGGGRLGHVRGDRRRARNSSLTDRAQEPDRSATEPRATVVHVPPRLEETP
ncbi:hypothetical protein L7F22_000059 [Adiantum nelumboides]|nr:hypothetical protein [Adiantum nelumboides]